MSDDQQIEGLPEGAVVRSIQQPAPAASDPSQVEGLPEGATLRPVTPPAPKSVAAPKPAAQQKSETTQPVAAKPKGAVAPPAPQKDLLTYADVDQIGLSPAQMLTVKAARAARGLYHGAMGDEETEASKGQKTTASPVAANLGFTPEHMGYNVGEMAHGVGKFIYGAAKDLVNPNIPVAIPDEVSGKSNASFWDRAKNMGDPEAHTLLAKYVSAPSMAERKASQDAFQKYFETNGATAAGNAILGFLHGTLGEYVPGIGPIAMALTDKAAKGDIGGSLAQLASLYAFEKGAGKLKEGITDRVQSAAQEITKTPQVKAAENNVEAMKKPLADAQKKFDAANAEHQRYGASHAQGIDSPKPIRAALDKAQSELDEAQAHHDMAVEHLEKVKAQQPTILQRASGAVGRVAGKVLPRTEATAPAEEVTTEKIEAAPKAEKPILATYGGKTPPKTGVEHATSTFPQEPTAAPRPTYGRIELPNNQGTMGKPLMLTEGTPEGPQIPKGGLPKIEIPKEETVPKATPKTSTAADLKALKAKEGKVVDTDDTIEGRVHKLLKEALQPEKPKPATEPAVEIPKPANAPAVEAPKAEEKRVGNERRQEEVPVENERRQGERRVLQQMRDKMVNEALGGESENKPIDTDAYAEAHVQARKELGKDADIKDVIKRRNEIVAESGKAATRGDIGEQSRQKNPEPTRAETKAAALPKEENTGYEAKKEEIVPVGNEGRNPAKSAEEYYPAIEQKVSELSDENLRKLARAHGLNPDEYDFKVRDERRHRTERDKLSKEIVDQMGEEERLNLGRDAESIEKEGIFHGADVSSQGHAARAEKMFPRLRGPVDQFGNPIEKP